MTEAQIQKTIIRWSQQASIRQAYPDLKLLHHIPNGGKRDKKEAAELKRQGVKAGVPDLCLPSPKGKYCGLYIELKTEKGELSIEQEWWLQELKKCGYCTSVAYGLTQALEQIEGYLRGDLG